MFRTQKHPALVGIVPRKNLWDIIQKERWYHIPIESAPKNVDLIEYLSFYFPSAFGKDLRYKVNFCANVKKVDVVKRIELFPEEKKHIRANKDYFQFHLGEIRKLPKPIPSLRWSLSKGQYRCGMRRRKISYFTGSINK